MLNDKKLSRRARNAMTAAALCIVASPAAFGGGWLEKGKDLLGGFAEEQAAGGSLSAGEIGAGLKQALRVGTERVVARLGQTGGFSSDPAVHIPLPQGLQTAKSTLGKFGMDAMLADLELKLNRAAEVATPKAKRLFWNAIAQMNLDDARAIYQGPEDAATQYFRGKMSAPLASEMRPVVTNSLSEVGAIETYDKVMARYENVPLMPDVKADLTDYVIAEGTDGIFYYLAKEEAAIREDPAARTTELLKKVFGG